MAVQKKQPYMNSDVLIDSIRRRALLPSTQTTFSEDDFLAFADEEMSLGLVPSVLSLHEDYFMFTQEIPVERDVINYPIPDRAIGNKLREVSFKDSSGNIFEMTRIGVGDRPYYNASTATRPYAFYIENNEVVLVPTTTALNVGTSLMMSYYMRPNSLVPVNQVGVITGINRMTGEIQLSNLPIAFAADEAYDFIQVKSPNKNLGIDAMPISVNTTSKTVTFDPNIIPAKLNINDNLALSTQCCIPQVPSDLHVVLAHRVAARCLEALGDSEGLQNANAKLAEMEVKSQNLIDNRVEDAVRKVVARHSPLRAGLSSRRVRYRGY